MLGLCIHDHQPVGNFESVLHRCFRECYLPMIEELERHPGVRLGLHISGPLLEWMEDQRPVYVERISDLCSSGRMELLTSGRYEPILPILPPDDCILQITEFSEHLRSISGSRPTGLWLTERVWEPHLVPVLAEAGVDHVVVDDIHLLRAGVPDSEINAPWSSFHGGRTVRLIPSSRLLRYSIPFSPVDTVMDRLAEFHRAGAEMVLYGDDGEKFGVWPGTADLCYRDGWLSTFLGALESADWIHTALPSEIAALPPRGPVFVPACSYVEMGEWTLHGENLRNYHEARDALAGHCSPEMIDVLVPGGFWRNFQTIYPESAELLGRMISAVEPVHASGDPEALDHLWRSQCNCAYWHGIFGGIYLPHLREALWMELSSAERLAVEASDGYPLILERDLDGDGEEELLAVTRGMSVLVHPAEGLSVTELTMIPRGGRPVPAGHVMSRVAEDYHGDIPEREGDAGSNIHGALPAKEEGLARALVADRWRRCVFTTLMMPVSLGMADWRACSPEVEHDQDLRWSELHREYLAQRLLITARCRHAPSLLEKRLDIDLAGSELAMMTDFGPLEGRLGTEVCLNMMTGASPDRYLRIDGEPAHLLGESGSTRCAAVEVIDEYRGIRVLIRPDREVDLWFAPIESVNRSESGFERVHQGVALYFSTVASGGEHSLGLSLGIEEYSGV